MLRACYEGYCDRHEAAAVAGGRAGKAARFSLARQDHLLFHSPFNRLVQKAVATLADAQRRRFHQPPIFTSPPPPPSIPRRGLPSLCGVQMVQCMLAGQSCFACRLPLWHSKGPVVAIWLCLPS